MEHSQATTQANDYTEAQKKALISSMCGHLMNKVKLTLENPKKNKQLAQNSNLLNLINLIAEHILPQYCIQNQKNSHKLNTMHSLCFLLASKTQSVFTSGVIRTCIDQNWDMKGFKSVFTRILQEAGLTVEDYKKLQDFFDKLIQSQNLQSQSCIKAISQFLRNKNRSTIDEDDLKNPIVSFQTTFPFVKAEIEKYREQNMSHTCFTVLHPWAYDLDLVDFKYVLNKDQTAKIVEALNNSFDAQVFWLSYFKAQQSTSADEFFGALKEVCIMNHIPDYFAKKYSEYKKIMIKNNFVISLINHADEISSIVSQVAKHAQKKMTLNILNDQVRVKQDQSTKTEFLDEAKALKILNLQNNDSDFKVIHKILPNSQQVQLSEEQAKQQLDLQRSVFKIKPIANQTQNIYLKFTNVDTEELKDLEIKFDGNQAQFKVGEGEGNHYVITNDKKLWESQFMILNQNGKYYIRDLGVVHTSRIKVNQQTQLQIHQGALLDLGKVVHYHVDKLLHEQVPKKESNPNFIVMRSTQSNYRVDEEALLRARPTWISADENKDLVQNEIILEPNEKKQVFSVGRSNRRDVEIKLKAVSADHCKIEYSREQGWFIHEREKDKLSSNGTFVFMKSLQQMDDHEPSDIIPLFNGMTISFINYELQVRIEPKTSEELSKSQYEEIDLNEINHQVSQSSISSHHNQHEKQSHQEKSIHQDDDELQQQSYHSIKSHKKEIHDDPYIENLQVTHQKQSQLQLIQEDRDSPKHSQQQQEEFKSQHSHRSQHSVSQASMKDQSQKHLDDVQSEASPSIYHDQSQRSLRQSVKSIHSIKKQQQQDDDKFSVNQDEYEDKMNINIGSSNHQSVKSLAQGSQNIRDQESHRQSIHQDDDERKSQHSDSPKSKSHKSQLHQQEDDEQQHEMLRSYSQHHIGEALDKASSHHQSQNKIIHSDDEEDKLPKNDQDQEEEKQGFSVHGQDEDVKSQKLMSSSVSVKHNQSVHDDDQENHSHHQSQDNRHQASKHSIQQDFDHVDIKEKDHSVQGEDVNHYDNLQELPSQHQASQKSLKQSVHDQSQKSLHQSLHNQSQKSLHDQSIQDHNASIHQDDQAHHQSPSKQSLHEKSQYSEHQDQQHDSSQKFDTQKSVHQEQHNHSVQEQYVHHSVHNQSVHDQDKDQDDDHNNNAHHDSVAHHNQSVHSNHHDVDVDSHHQSHHDQTQNDNQDANNAGNDGENE